MPVDQAIQYVKSQAAVGVAPLVDLYAMLNQFQRMKQPPVQPPPNMTVKQQLNMAEAARMGLGNQQMPPQMPQQGAPQQAPMAQGLGGLDAGAMENPGFAGGGIVAFDEGGITAANVKKQPPKSWEEVQAQSLAGSEETVEGLENYLKTQDEIDKRLSLGKYAPSRKLKESQATRIESATAADEAKQAELDRRAYYADMGQIASEQGTREKKAPTYLDVLARSQKGAVDRAQKRFEEKKTATLAAENARIKLAEADEALAKGDLDGYKAKVAEVKKMQDKATEKIAGETYDIAKDERTRQREIAVERLRADLRQKIEDNDPNVQVMRDLIKKYPNEPEKVIDIMKGYSQRNDWYFRSQLDAAEAEERDALKNVIPGADPNKDPAVIAARKKLQDIRNQISAAGVGGANKGATAPPPNVATPQLPPGFTRDKQ